MRSRKLMSRNFLKFFSTYLANLVHFAKKKGNEKEKFKGKIKKKDTYKSIESLYLVSIYAKLFLLFIAHESKARKVMTQKHFKNVKSRANYCYLKKNIFENTNLRKK